MEVSMSSIAGAIFVVSLVTWALNLVWLRPKKLEICLRKQGFKGNPYRFLFGDLKDSFSAIKEAYSKPISLSDDIVPRIFPFDNHIIEKYGNDSFMWFGRVPSVNIMEPEQIKDVFVRIVDFPKPNAFKLLGNGLPNLPAKKWAVHKKIINPAFHVEKLKFMLPAMHLSCSEMINKWENSVSAEGSCELDAWPFLQNLMGEVISRTAFGSNYEEGRTIFQLQTENAKLLVEAIHAPNIPGWRFVPTTLNKRIKEINNTMHSVLKIIINKREKAMEAGEAANDDLLGILLESNMKEIRDHGNNKKHAGLTLDEVIEECKIFYSAGQETTSVLLVWTMVLLSQHPTWQDRARGEVLEVFGDKKPDYEGLNHLKIMTMILNEVLRLYPPVPKLARILDKETKLGNLTLPAGVQIVLPLLLVQHDRNIWGDDAKEFKPERFANGISNATKNQASFFSFGWGPRMCIGQNFAMIEAKLTLAMILQHFWFELSPSYTHAPFSILSLQPQHGCHVVLHKH